MTCQYCRAQNDTDAHRCNRCGRRTLDRIPVQMTAAVPELKTVEMPAPSPLPLRPHLVTEPAAQRPASNSSSNPGAAYQASLFGPVLNPREAGRPDTSAPSRKTSSRPRRDHSRQQTLDFQETRSLHNSIQASVYCDAPVAITAHRVMAAAVDSVLALAALAVFAGTFYVAGADVILTKQTVPFYATAAFLIVLFYRALFCIANQDTPGVRWTGLQILDFDGRVPTRRHRWHRLLGGVVGAIAAGIGLIWAIFDEERLTWHDRMSETFPTPRFL